MSGFFEELKRRKVIRVALGYAVGAFAVIQVAEAVFPRVALPDWTVTLVVWLAILAFPPALILAWAFDVTPDGIRRASAGNVSAAARAPATYLGIGILVALVGVAAYVVIADRDPGGKTLPRSVAVLPFTNLGRDSADQYFSDGVSEEILNGLSRLPGLTVVGRTSSFKFRGRDIDAKQVGQTLGVAALLSGTVQRQGDAVRITVELTNARTGVQMWSQKYDRQLGNLFALEDDIARATTDALRIELAGGPIVPKATVSSEAHDLVLRANALSLQADESDLLRAVALYKQALAIDSTYAEAWANLSLTYGGLADAYRAPREMLPLIEASALSALRADSSLALAHAALGTLRVDWQWRFAEANREFRRALELDPGSSATRQEYAPLLIAIFEDYGAAERELSAAAARDPLNPNVARWRATAAIDAGRFDDALRFANRVAELSGGRTYYAFNRVAQVYTAMGRWHDCLRALGPDTGTPDLYRGICEARSGNRAAALRILEQLQARRYIDGTTLAYLYVALGDKDAAFRELNRAVTDRSANVPTIRVVPWLAELRDDPRFAALLREVGLPAHGPPAGMN